MENVATFSLQVVPAEIVLQRVLVRAPARISVSLRFLRYPALHVSDAQLGDDAQTRNADTTLVLGLGKGKSCLFQEQPTRLSEQLMREPLFFIVEAVREKRNGSNAGTSSSSSSSSSSLVATGALPLRWNGGGDVGHFFEGKVPLLTPMGSVAGHMKLVAHLRCHGMTMAQHISETVARAQAEAARGRHRQREEEESDSGHGDGDARTQVATHSLAADLEERIAQRRRKEESWWEKEERIVRSRPVPQRRPGPPMLFYANDGEGDSEDEDERHIDCDGERIETLDANVVSPASTVVVPLHQHKRGNAVASHSVKDKDEDEGMRALTQSSDEEHKNHTATKATSSLLSASETKENLSEKDEKIVRDDEEKGPPLPSAHVSHTSTSDGSGGIDNDEHHNTNDVCRQDQHTTPHSDVSKPTQSHLQRSFAFVRDEGEQPSSSDTGGGRAADHVGAVAAADSISSDSSRAFLDSSGHIDSVTSSRDDFASPDATAMLSEVYSPDADHHYV